VRGRSVSDYLLSASSLPVSLSFFVYLFISHSIGNCFSFSFACSNTHKATHFGRWGCEDKGSSTSNDNGGNAKINGELKPRETGWEREKEKTGSCTPGALSLNFTFCEEMASCWFISRPHSFSLVFHLSVYLSIYLLHKTIQEMRDLKFVGADD
jgi:hypothetical protein